MLSGISCSSIHSHVFSFFPLNSFFFLTCRSTSSVVSEPCSITRKRDADCNPDLTPSLLTHKADYRCRACDLCSLCSCCINGVIRATSNKKQVFLNTHYSKALIVIQLTTRVCANNSSAGQREGEPRGSRGEHRWSADVSVPGGSSVLLVKAVYFPVSHLRMCPGTERLLRPRWFTAWTIILLVQLTLP